MGISTFFRHLRVLIWKNAILKLRHWVVLFFEIAIPAGLLVALVGLKSAVKDQQIRVSYPGTYWKTYTGLDEMYEYSPCDKENLVWRCGQESCVDEPTLNFTGIGCQRRKIAVAPYQSSDTGAATAAADFILWANNRYELAKTYDTFQYFPSEDDFVNLIKQSSYSQSDNIPVYSTAIIFDSGYPSWQYQLRINQSYATGGSISATPATSGSALDLSVKSNEAIGQNYNQPYNQLYLDVGVLALMDVVSSFVATKTCQRQGSCSSLEQVNVVTDGTADFPNPKIKISNFWSLAAFSLALIIIISVLYPLANVISVLVKEKEGKLREGMLMMSLREDAYWAAWAVNFLIFFLVLSIVLTAIGSQVFTHSNFVYVFIYFFVFFMGSVSYCFFISTLFNKSRTATIVGVLLFFAGYFIYVGVSLGSKTQPSRSSLLAACLHPACAFVYASLAFAEWEDTNVGITSNTWNNSNLYNITFQDTINLMFADFWIYGFLFWYFNQVFPSEFGTPKPPYFFLLPSYWISCGKGFLSCICGPSINRRSIDYAAVRDSTREIEMVSTVEPVTENLAAQVEAKTCVEIKGLYKAFQTNTGTKVAVDHLSLTMYSGQITALLGHNGAGKTTAISMLTGLIPADGGDALIEGLSINDDMDEIRKNLGVCPQHDILYPDLTVQEHLIMFAAFKGCPRDKIPGEVEKMIQSVGLTEKRNVYSQNLSGGQKRKLSLANAFVGGSRIVFLDEPTSGMDPYSRRFTWNVIRQHREGRVVVLTTHFMDEADLLGDRIAIMGDGRLLTCGSSLYLKRMFGVGYNMTMEKIDAISFDSDKVEALITSRVPDAKVLTNVGAEMTMQLPFASSGQFEPLFSHIDDNAESLGIRSYGMSVTTLEEVFINVAHGTKTQAQAEKGRLLSSEVKSGTGKNSNSNQVAAAEVVEDIEANDNALADFDKIDPSRRLTYFFRHMYAMLMKRYLYFVRDTKSWVLQIILPVLFVLGGMLIMYFSSYVNKEPRITLSTDLYNDKIGSNYNPLAYSAAPYFCPPQYYETNDANVANFSCYAVHNQTSLVNKITNSNEWPLLPVTSGSTIGKMSEYLSVHRTDREAMQVAGLTYTQTIFYNNHIADVHYVVHANYTAIHGAPLGSAYATQGIVQSINPDASVNIKLHPLPFTGHEETIVNSYNANLLETFVTLAIPFIPASWATYIVREREVKAKHVQLVSGVSIVAYWLATYIWDILAYQLTMWGFIILFVSFPHTESVSSTGSGALGVTIGVFLLFGPAMAGFTYLLTFLFTNPASVQVTMIFLVFVLGFLLTIVGYILRLIPTSKHVYINGLRYLFALFPPFALGDALQNLTLRDSLSFVELKGGEMYSVHDWKISGLNITFLAWECVAYIGLTILFEYLKTIPRFQGAVSTIRASDLPPANDSVKDEDVLAEEKRVLLPETAQNSTILVKDLKKMYPGGKYAVRGVSLGIPNGECFGLLGINGAGKSSLLAMLSGETQPTAGDAYLSGLNLLTDIHECRRKIGFCPQFDALFELLTGREHLQLYARIKGIVEKDIDRVVNYKIAEMGLTEYADRAAGTYSGGNKRKLSVAIAMIGDPEIVFLDEPSTGMDPVARRFMWEVITNIVTKRESCSMILTTHSMEECEALCTRIGIMVGGALRCLGSSQRLRSRYGTGYQLEFGFTIPSEEQMMAQVDQLVNSLNLKMTAGSTDYSITFNQVMQVIPMLNRPQWIDRVSYNGSAQELYHEVKASGYIHARSLANWIIMEENYDNLIAFLDRNFPGYEVRERQVSKLRIVVPEMNDGYKRKLSALFGAVERNKESLFLEEYSVCQTSLEQIFNHFASQQEEEQGHAAGIVTSNKIVKPANVQVHTYPSESPEAIVNI